MKNSRLAILEVFRTRITNTFYIFFTYGFFFINVKYQNIFMHRSLSKRGETLFTNILLLTVWLFVYNLLSNQENSYL